MDPILLIAALNRSLPALIALYRSVRDGVQKTHPAVPALSDGDLISLLGQTAETTIAHADRLLERWHAGPDANG